jgi:hypothetical protein
VGFFSKREQTPVPAEVLGLLGQFGYASLDARASGRPVVDDRFGWAPFFSKAMPALQTDVTRAVGAVHQATAGDEHACFGGYLLIAEYNPELADPRYLEMMDAGLQLMHRRGFSSGHLTRYEADRWIATYGDLRTSFDRIEEVSPPPQGQVQQAAMEPGQSVMVSKQGPGALDNQFWIERSDDGLYQAYSMRRWDQDAVILSRSEESSIGRWDDVDGVLRSLGAYLRTPSFWAHEILQPYFTERRA